MPPFEPKPTFHEQHRRPRPEFDQPRTDRNYRNSAEPFRDVYDERKFANYKPPAHATRHPLTFGKLPASELDKRSDELVYMVVSMPRKLLRDRHDAGAPNNMHKIEEQVRILGYHDTSGEYNPFDNAI